MNPRVQYTTTSDGVNIAYWVHGDGPALLLPPPAQPWSHIERELDIPEWRHWYEHLARHCSLIRYDSRGSGLSDRNAKDISLDGWLRDIEAVADAAGLDRFALFGIYFNGPLAIRYAARHPERVSHLVLWCSFARTLDVQGQTARREAFDRLLQIDYELLTETMAHTVFGWSEGEEAHRVAEYMRMSAAPEAIRDAWDVGENLDVRDDLPYVRCPTLVMHRRQFPLIPLDISAALASAIPDAKLAVVDGASLAPYIGDMEQPLRILDEFLEAGGRLADDASHARSAVSGGFRTIMFTDIEGSTATTQRLGDAQAQEIIRTHNRIVRDALHSFDGTEVKHTGDGIMASFTSTVLSLECAIAVQRRLVMHQAMNVEHPPFSVRIGINAGEPVVDGDDLFGTAVQLASRICTRAEAHQILVSDVVRQLVAGKGFLFADHGETDLRGFEEPVRLFELRWREAGE